MTSTSRNVSMRLLKPTDGAGNVAAGESITYVPISDGMVSMRTLTWTFILMQLVISCACFIASLAIISAKFNSESRYEEKQYVSFEWWIFCGLSFSMIINTIAAMYALSEHNRFLLIPHILVLILCNSLACYVLHYTVANFDSSDFNWHIGLMSIIFTGTHSFQHQFQPKTVRNFQKASCSRVWFSRSERCVRWPRRSILDLFILFLLMARMEDVTVCLKATRHRLLALLASQSIVALFLLVGALPITLDSQTRFSHDFIRFILHGLLLFTFLWFIGSVLAILFRDNLSFLRAHIIFNLFVTIVHFLKMCILCISGELAPFLLSLVINILNFWSVHCESQVISALSK